MSESEPTKSTSTEPQIAENIPKPTTNYPAWIAALATVGMLIATGVNVWINKLQGEQKRGEQKRGHSEFPTCFKK